MSFDEFINSDKYRKHKEDLINFFENERQLKNVLSFNEWEDSIKPKIIFFTYDFIDVKINNPNYSIINDFIKDKLHFTTNIDYTEITNNSFVIYSSKVAEITKYADEISNLFKRYNQTFRLFICVSDTYYNLNNTK